MHSGWPLPQSMQTILEQGSWQDLAEAICDEISHDPAVAAVWAVRWEKASDCVVVAAAGREDILQVVATRRWPDCADGELLSLALASPMRQLPVDHVMLSDALPAEHLTELTEVMLIPLLEQDDRPWTLILLLNQPLSATEELGRRLQFLWQAQSRNLQQEIISRACECAGNSMFLTDASGRIVWINPAFTTLTGYTPQQALGQNPRLLNSGRQSARYYRRLWQTIQAGEVWSEEATDKDRYGYLYTIQQTISPVFDESGISHFFSVHDDISRRKNLEIKAEREQPIDATTGLLNTAAFMDALASQLRQSRAGQAPFTVVSFSISNFSSVTASLTETTRQQLLHEVGRRICQGLNRKSCGGTLGSGDFGLLLVGADASREQACLQQLQESLSAPYPLLQADPFFVYSHGTARYPDDADTAQALWHYADSANGSPR